MPEDGRLASLLKRTARTAGRRYAEIRHSYEEGRESSEGNENSDAAEPRDPTPEPEPRPDLSYLPRNEDGDARIVCRRYAEKRAVAVDEAGRPECFDPDHPDCQGCVEDVRDGVVETW
jgi:hypothetical protein